MPNEINAVLVTLSLSVFSNIRQDQQITDEVKLKKALGVGAGKWMKYKLPDECLVPIRKFCGIVRQFHYDHTSPWEKGKRLLSAAARANYDARVLQFQREFFAIVDEFGTQYPNWIEQSKIMHAGTWEPSDYPSWALCRTMFNLKTLCEPVPQPEHFNKKMRELYGDALNQITSQRVNEAVADTWDRLMKPVQAMAEKLSQPDAVFRDSLVENVKEMVTLVPLLNLTGDARLAAAARDIQAQLTAFDADTLRESKVDRKEVAKRAATLAARFGALGQRKLAA